MSRQTARACAILQSRKMCSKHFASMGGNSRKRAKRISGTGPQAARTVKALFSNCGLEAPLQTPLEDSLRTFLRAALLAVATEARE